MNEIIRMLDEINGMFYEKEKKGTFPIDIIEIENGYRVDAELPGVDKDSIDVSFEDGYLTINAVRKEKEMKYLIRERKDVKYNRVIYFGDIKEDSISAKLECGVLSIHLKKEEKLRKNIVIE